MKTWFRLTWSLWNKTSRSLISDIFIPSIFKPNMINKKVFWCNSQCTRKLNYIETMQSEGHFLQKDGFY